MEALIGKIAAGPLSCWKAVCDYGAAAAALPAALVAALRAAYSLLK